MPIKLTRRQILAGAALAAAAGAVEAAGQSRSSLSSVTVGPRSRETGGDALVVLFLRGGADGLNVIVPHADDDYHKLRPTLGLARPNDRSAAAYARALDLDGFFGLHPALAPLLPLYREGRFAAVHAVGSGDQTRSHFEAMATMEHGMAQETGAASGWLARHLSATAQESESPLRAVAIAETMPDSLRGATNATALTNLTDFRLTAPNVMPTGAHGKVFHAPPRRADAVAETLRGMYAAGETDTLRAAGREALAALEAIKRLDPAHYRPEPGAAYPAGDVGRGFRQVACLLKGDVGLEIACLDMGGWDTHVAQGRDSGWQPLRLAKLGKALAAFAADLGPRMERVTTVVMTEFGRRAYENSGAGTDHGRASVMFLLGGGIVGGKVYADWPGLAEHQLDGPGDLRVTTDYRDILAELVTKRLHNDNLAAVFPEYTPGFRGVARA